MRDFNDLKKIDHMHPEGKTFLDAEVRFDYMKYHFNT